MGKLKTKAPTEQYRSTVGQLKVLAKEDDFLFKVEVALLNGLTNRNNWRYENLEAHRELFAETPILVAYVNGKVGDGHNMHEKRDPVTGETSYSFMGAGDERIVGWFKEDDDIRMEERDGTQWIVGTGYIWSWYAPELTELLTSQGSKGMEVSIETYILDGYMDGSTEVFTRYKILGTTILGEGVTPAVAGANIRKMSALDSQLKDFKLKVASYQTQKHEPHETKKGVRTELTALNKRQLAELQPRFGDYKVLAAAMTEDKTIHVALMSADGATCRYTLGSIDENTIAIERIEKIGVNASFDFDGSVVSVDVCEMLDALGAEIVTANNTAKAAQEALDKANATIEAMNTVENTRRVNAAKAKALATLSAFNADRIESERVEASAIDAISENAANGVYNNSVDAEGNWLGESAVEDAVYAVCAKKVQEMDAKKAKEARTVFAFDKLRNEKNSDDGTVAGKLEAWGIR